MGVKVKQFTGGDTLCSLLGVFQTIMAMGHRVSNASAVLIWSVILEEM